MRVTDTLTFDEDWRDAQFECKKPHLAGSKKQAFGDNIYHRDSQGRWMQANSHHSRADGSPNRNNIERDTSVDRVLVSEDFVYFGGSGPALPDGLDVCKRGPGHRCKFSAGVVRTAVDWLADSNAASYKGRTIGKRCLGRPFIACWTLCDFPLAPRTGFNPCRAQLTQVRGCGRSARHGPLPSFCLWRPNPMPIVRVPARRSVSAFLLECAGHSTR